MAYDDMDAAERDGTSGSWRRGWASAGALIATVLLIALVVMVTLSNRARDDALAWERHTYDVMLLTRTVDASIARSEAALGRFVLDENEATSGTLYYNEWRLAGRQIERLSRLVRDDAQQARQVAELQALYEQRGEELAAAAAAAVAGRESGGVPLFYQAGLSETGPDLRAKLDAIATTERGALRERMAATRMFDEEADQLTEWLGWMGVFVGVSAILLGIAAYRALTERLIAREEAAIEADRASTLEGAVNERTRELREANARLIEEAAERAAAEARLRQVQKMEAVGQLTGGIAHDFNNMLAVVVGGLDLARRKLAAGDSASVRAYLDSAMEGATRAGALTRRLLAFARSEPMLPHGIAPAELVEGMLELIDRSIGDGITVTTLFPELPWHVWADTNQLESAVLNLAVNARDAMDGRGALEIAIDNVTLAVDEVGALPAGDYVRIAVSDSGAGIAPEILERVFEPFFTTKPVGKGTGLGLSQIFGFARQSGGDVAIDSEVGRGTTVALYLPRSAEAADAATRQPRPGLASAAADHAPAGQRILVVEDDPRVSRSTVSALEELGYRTLACASGKEALEVMAREPDIDLIVTDVMMPEMTGPELVRRLAGLYPDVRILFVTGYVGDGGDMMDLTGYDIVRKPFTLAALADAVARALAGPLSESPPASASAAAE